MTQSSDSITSGGAHVVFAETVFDLAAGTLRHLPQPTEWTATVEDVRRLARLVDAAYQRGYADAVRFVEAEAAQRAAANEAGRGE